MSNEESEIIVPEMIAGNHETRAEGSASTLTSLLSLAWTKDLPTEPGYYWIDGPDADGPYIDHVDVRPGHSYLAVQQVLFSGKRDFTPVQYVASRWAGPILIPK